MASLDDGDVDVSMWPALVFLVFVFFTLTYVSRRLYAAITRAHASSRAGCAPPPAYAHRTRSGADLEDDIAAATQRGDQLGFAAARFAQYGKTYRSTCRGRTRIHTCDVRNLQAVFATQRGSFEVAEGRGRVNGGVCGGGILRQEGKAWAHSRRIFSAVLRGNGFVVPKAVPHIERLLGRVPDGATVDLQPLLTSTILDISTEWLFGHGTHSLDPNSSGAFNANRFVRKLDEVQILEQEREKRGTNSWLRRADRGLVGAYNEIDQVLDCLIASIAKQGEKAPPCFVRQLMAHTRDPRWLRNQVLGVFQHARDSTAQGLADVFSHLARHPHVWSELRRECWGVKGPIDADKLLRLQYARLVIRESLRLNPPLGTTLRTVVKDTILPTGGGPQCSSPVFVAAGSEVECDWTVTQRDPEFWGTDAAEFRPERWIPARPRWEYIPFLGGPRVCPAQHLVLLQYLTVLWRVAQEVERI